MTSSFVQLLLSFFLVFSLVSTQSSNRFKGGSKPVIIRLNPQRRPARIRRPIVKQSEIVTSTNNPIQQERVRLQQVNSESRLLQQQKLDKQRQQQSAPLEQAEQQRAQLEQVKQLLQQQQQVQQLLPVPEQQRRRAQLEQVKQLLLQQQQQIQKQQTVPKQEQQSPVQKQVGQVKQQPVQQFIPRNGAATPPPPPPLDIPPDVQNQLIRFFGLDSFGIPGLTGYHPSGFGGAMQELRAAGIPIAGLPPDDLTGTFAVQTPATKQVFNSQQALAFSQSNQQIKKSLGGIQEFSPAGSGANSGFRSSKLPLPAVRPGEDGLIGLLSSGIRRLVQDSGVAEAINQGLPNVLNSESGGSAVSTAANTEGGTASLSSAPNLPLVGSGSPRHAGLPRIPGLPILPNGIPRNARGQIDAVNLIGQITRRVSNGTTLADLLPPEQLQTFADNITNALLPSTPKEFDLEKMMGRWFEGINSPRATQHRCVVHHYGGLTNNARTATFTALKIYREGSEFGPVRYSIGYAFRGGSKVAMLQMHTSESPDAQPFWVYKLGPEGIDPFGNVQYEWAIISNWVKYPVTVLVRDPDVFKQKYEEEVLRWLEDQGFINGFSRAFNLLQPAEYSSCQYSDSTFEIFG